MTAAKLVNDSLASGIIRADLRLEESNAVDNYSFAFAIRRRGRILRLFKMGKRRGLGDFGYGVGDRTDFVSAWSD